MRIFRSDDRGDPFVVVFRDKESADERPLAEVLPFNAHGHEERRRICTEAAAELNRAVELMGEVVTALVDTNVWREFAPPGSLAKPLPPSLRAHLHGRDPAIRHAARVRHALMSATRALMAIAAKGFADE